MRISFSDTSKVDTLEAESEAIRVAKNKRTAKSDVERLKEVNISVEKHKGHMLKMEIMMRMLENGALEVDDVNFGDVRSHPPF